MRVRGWSRGEYPLALVALGAAAVSVVVTLALRTDPHANPDSWAFEALARSLLAGHGLHYREPLIPGLDFYAFRSPVYAAFLAFGLALGGATAVVALQGALNGISAALVGAIAGRLGGVRAAWIAFALRMVWPAAWGHAGQFMSEIPFEFLSVLATWIVLRAIERRRAAWAVPAGALVGLAVLTRPVGAGLALALSMWLLFKFPRAAFTFVLAAALVWAPWPIRNAERLHAFVPLLTIGGVTTWCPTTGHRPDDGWRIMAENASLGEIGLDRHFWALTNDYTRQHPGERTRRVLEAFFRYLGPLRFHSTNAWLHRFALVAVLAALALPGARRRLTLPALIWAAQGALLAVVIVFDRYRFPTDWCVVVAAALGLAAFAERFGARRAVAWSAVVLLAAITASVVLAHG